MSQNQLIGCSLITLIGIGLSAGNAVYQDMFDPTYAPASLLGLGIMLLSLLSQTYFCYKSPNPRNLLGISTVIFALCTIIFMAAIGLQTYVVSPFIDRQQQQKTYKIYLGVAFAFFLVQLLFYYIQKKRQSNPK